jgi:glucosylceramidase
LFFVDLGESLLNKIAIMKMHDFAAFRLTLLAFLGISFMGVPSIAQAQLVGYTTTANGHLKFEKQLPQLAQNTNKVSVLQLTPKERFQKMEGFGYTFTGGSAQLIHALTLQKQNALLQEIFGKGASDLGVSYVRISMGASDLDEKVFSYCDLPNGFIDTALAHFTLAQDTMHLIPLLQKAIKINPHLKIMASPWSAPIWMKSNGASKGGHLLKQYYATYARYFVKYIKAMQSKGLPIHAVTIQNEPQHGGNNPSMLMDAAEQTEFVRDYLGPQFKAARLNTEIVIWDHNADHPEYPIHVLNDAKAKSFIAASAFHLYLGNETALSQVHEQHPNRKIYFTEQWTGAKGDYGGDLMWHMEHVVIGTIQNWSSLVLEWNLAANAKYEPHTIGGCTECKGAFTIQGEAIQRNVSYYIIGQISKFVPPGSIRIGATVNNELVKTVAFLKPNGQLVAILLNTSPTQEISIKLKEKATNFTLPKQSVTTLVW